MIIKYNSSEKRKNSRHRFSKARRAALLIEIAFILPVLMVVLILSIDISRFLIVTMALNNAVDQGVVSGSNTALNLTSQSTWDTQIRTSVSNSMAQYKWFNPANLSVNVPVPSTTNGLIDSSGFRSIQVQISYQTDYVIPWQGYTSPNLVTITLTTDQIR